ncbi:MAG TPA: hypothetical protein VD962_10400 [Rubricoccaceae bacterium]|nr:hypothetical protein [Rubricoccaceae bacterium]
MLTCALRRTLLGALLVAACALLAAPEAHAQDGTRIIRSWTDDVKVENGRTEQWEFVIAYDPATGALTQTARNHRGVVMSTTDLTGHHIAPNEEEIADAVRLIRNDPELAAVLAAAPGHIISGGFNLVRPEIGCEATSRCLQFDLMQEDLPNRRVNRLRYVVVDLRTGQFVSRNYNPANDGRR